jgi:hypothetical protein
MPAPITFPHSALSVAALQAELRRLCLGPSTAVTDSRIESLNAEIEARRWKAAA